MKLFINLCLVLISLTFESTFSGNIPGFYGRKTQINYECHSFFSFPAPNANHQTGLYPSMRNGFNLQHTISKNKMIGISYQWFKTSAQIDWDYQNGSFYPYNVDGLYLTSDSYGNVHGFFNINAFEIGPNIRFYTQNWLAPLGNFIQLDIQYLSYKVSGLDNLQIETDSYTGIPIINYKKIYNGSPYKKIVLGVTFGKERILLKRISINYGLRLGLLYYNMFSSTVDSKFPINKEIQISASQSLFFHNYINFYFGIGSIF